MDLLGIEFLTVMGLPPVEFVQLAAQLGCRHISTALNGSYINPNAHPNYDLRTDIALRTEMLAALGDSDVSISLGEGFVVQPGDDVRGYARDLDLMQTFGVMRVNVVSMDPDVGRTFDQYAIFTEIAAAAGMRQVVTEFAPVLTVRDLPMALDAVRHVDRPDFRLLVDTMHLCRTGGTAAQIAALDPSLIGYVQLSDAPMVPVMTDYMEEAMTARLAPGQGSLPLDAVLAALPRDVLVSLEVPQCDRALAGQSRAETVGSIVASARAMLAKVST